MGLFGGERVCDMCNNLTVCLQYKQNFEVKCALLNNYTMSVICKMHFKITCMAVTLCFHHVFIVNSLPVFVFV